MVAVCAECCIFSKKKKWDESDSDDEADGDGDSKEKHSHSHGEGGDGSCNHSHGHESQKVADAGTMGGTSPSLSSNASIPTRASTFSTAAAVESSVSSSTPEISSKEEGKGGEKS